MGLILRRGRLCLGLRGNVVELTGGGAAAGGRLGQNDDVGEIGSVPGHKGEVLVDSVLLNNLGSIMVHIQPWPESMTNETIKIEMSEVSKQNFIDLIFKIKMKCITLVDELIWDNPKYLMCWEKIKTFNGFWVHLAAPAGR